MVFSLEEKIVSPSLFLMQIGSFTPSAPTVLAPMAGVTDAACRRMAREMGAGWTVGEMAASEARLRTTAKTTARFKTDSTDPFPVIQLLGADPREMAEAARFAQEAGAAAVDINFGCPARVVCGKACGSALMQEPELAEAIVKETVEAVSIPVTVKMRTGWDRTHKNAVELAQRFEGAGAALLTVHGRTRADKFTGTVDYQTIAEVVKAVSIPVVANGDIATAQKAVAILKETGAAGVMMGRGAIGNPWLFARTAALLSGEKDPGEPKPPTVEAVLLKHLDLHLALNEADPLYALRSFRKFLMPYLARFPGGSDAAKQLVRSETAEALTDGIRGYFFHLSQTNDHVDGSNERK